MLILFSKLNVSKVVRACERARLFTPAGYLYMQDKQSKLRNSPAIKHVVYFSAMVSILMTWSLWHRLQ